MLVRRLSSLLLIVLAAALPHTARAQPGPAAGAAPTTDPKEMARRFGEQALTAHAEGRFAEAYEGFEKAEKIAHSPVLVLWMARSKRGLDQLLAARALYQRAAGEALPADASAKWVTAQAEAKSELAALERRIPRLTVTLKDAEGATLTLDGAPLAIGAVRELDPGSHELRLTRSGAPDRVEKVDLAEGDPPRTIALDATPGAGGVVPVRSEGSIVPGAVLTAIGGAGLAAGAVTGALALVLAGEVTDNCVGNACLRADEEKAGDADRLARASTGLFIAGGILAATGVVLIVVRPGGDARESAALRLGPSGARFSLAF